MENVTSTFNVSPIAPSNRAATPQETHSELMSAHPGSARVDSTPLAAPSSNEIVNVIQGEFPGAQKEEQQKLSDAIKFVRENGHKEAIQEYEHLLRHPAFISFMNGELSRLEFLEVLKKQVKNDTKETN